MLTLVTGAAGFIGSAVVRKLVERGRRVRCMVLAGEDTSNLASLDVELVTGDVRDLRSVDAAMDGCEVLYHLAAIYKLWHPRPEEIYRVNVDGSRNVLLSARRHRVRRTVYTSSIAAIGYRPDRLADETVEFDQWRQGNDYIRSKWLGENVARGFAADGDPIVIVNPAFPFGPGDVAPTPTGQTVVEVLRGTLPGYSDGGINVVDVDDCAEGHLLAEDVGRVGERYILGSHNVTHRDFFRAVARIGGVDKHLFQVPTFAALGAAWALERWATMRGAEPFYTYQAVRFASRRLWFDVSKATTELGMPHTPLEQTIERTVAWFRNRL